MLDQFRGLAVEVTVENVLAVQVRHAVRNLLQGHVHRGHVWL